MCTRNLSTAACIVVFVAGFYVARAESPRIEWEVLNPFRLFLDPADTAVHRAVWSNLSERERRSPVLAAERHLAEGRVDGWAAGIFAKTCWTITTVLSPKPTR